jgi:VWFA-related protein
MICKNFKLHKVISIFGLLIAIFLSPNNSFAQDDTINIDTNLVTVPVTVFDRQGRYITDLQKENFQVFEDGVEQEITFFEPVNKPLSVFLLVDVSGSMYQQFPALALAGNTFIRQLRPDDKITIALFATDIDTVIKESYVKDVLGKETVNLSRKRSFRSKKILFDSVEKAMKKFKEISGRKALILFSDGMGSGYFASAKSNLRDAEESEALIYTIQFVTYRKVPPKYVSKKYYYQNIDKANKYLKGLAEISGGFRIQIDNIDELKEAYKKITDELSQQYTIGYSPRKTGKKGESRNIKVKVNIPNAAVRARKSYIVGSNKD